MGAELPELGFCSASSAISGNKNNSKQFLPAGLRNCGVNCEVIVVNNSATIPCIVSTVNANQPLRSDTKDFEELPWDVRAALESIWDGKDGDSVEGQTLELKEDPAVYLDRRAADAKLIEILVDETVCLANGDGGEKHLIIGVSDKKRGPEAFTGSTRDIQWLRKRIFDRTRPNLTVDASTFYFHEVPLVWLRVPEALALYTRTDGAAKRRVGKMCEVLNEEQRRELSWRRRNPDRTASPANISLGDLEPLALEAARILLTRKNSGYEAPHTSLALLGDLGLLTSEGQPTFAAFLLFCSGPQSETRVEHYYRDIPGAEPIVHTFNDPLILAMEKVKRLISERSSSEVARITYPSGQEVAIPEFPATAVDEIVTNAFVHRDWEMHGPIIIEQSRSYLSVVSPGPLPEGVREDRLLTTRSVPRNPLLMAGMRALGLVEQQSRGFDRIWLSLLNSGRCPPRTQSDQLDFTVAMAAGAPDIGFIKAVDQVKMAFHVNVSASVSAMLILRYLFDHPLMTEKTAAELLQADLYAVQETCEWLERVEIIQRVRNLADEWTLSEKVARIYSPYNGIDADKTAVSVEEWIDSALKAGESLEASQVAKKFGVTRERVTEILRHLRNRGTARIDPDGPQRGRGTRWIQV